MVHCLNLKWPDQTCPMATVKVVREIRMAISGGFLNDSLSSHTDHNQMVPHWWVGSSPSHRPS